VKAAGKGFRKALSALQESQRADLKSLLIVLGQDHDGLHDEHEGVGGESRLLKADKLSDEMTGASACARPMDAWVRQDEHTAGTWPEDRATGVEAVWWHEHARVDPMAMWRDSLQLQEQAADERGGKRGKDVSEETATLASRMGWSRRGGGLPGAGGDGDQHGRLEMVACTGTSQVGAPLFALSCGDSTHANANRPRARRCDECMYCAPDGRAMSMRS
jgi:hypothetical protein